MTPEDIKATITQVIVGLGLLGGLAGVYSLVRDGIVSGDAGLAVFAAVITGALAYLTNAKVGDQTQKAFDAGLAATPVDSKK